MKFQENGRRGGRVLEAQRFATSAPALVFRAGVAGDAGACGQVCYEAFATVAAEHGFPPDFPSAEVAGRLCATLLSHPQFSSVVAEDSGRVVGSIFMDERSSILGIGPLTVDPEQQNRGVGRRLMGHALARAEEGHFAGARLLQAAYHNRSLGLYASLGFAVRETFACLQGQAGLAFPGRAVRRCTAEDLPACDSLCRAVHGHHRSGELRDAIGRGSALVVERDGRITAYASAQGFFGHAVGETGEDLEALIGAAERFEGPGILVPVRDKALFSWCLAVGLRVVFSATLMSSGLYNEPEGAYLPSILY
jgi:predicted N-acetyltransferase YhbS